MLQNTMELEQYSLIMGIHYKELYEFFFQVFLYLGILISFLEFPWDPIKFSTAPSGYWEKDENIIDALNTLATRLDIKSPEDWYGVTKSQWNAAGMSTLITRYGMLGLLSKYIKGRIFFSH